MARTDMIEIRDLYKLLHDDVLLEPLTLSVAKGEVFGLLGPEGSGKSTVLKLLATVMRPTAGDATIGGCSVVGQVAAAQRLLGYQPSFFGLYDDMRVYEYLEFFALACGVNIDQRRAWLDHLLELAGLASRREKFIDSLDREQRQRLGIIKAAVHDPPVLLLDEPAAGLEPAARQRIRELIAALAPAGKTVVIGSNILADLAGFCQRIGIMLQGRLLRVGPADEITRQLLNERFIELEIQGDAAKARDQLRASPHVRMADSQDKYLICSLDEPSLDPAEIVRDLCRQGIPVVAWREHQVDLDEDGAPSEPLEEVDQS